MHRIAISMVEFLSADINLKSSINSLETFQGSLPEAETNGVAFKNYRDMFEEINELMVLYKKLAERDLKLIEKSYTNFFETDKSNLMQNVGGKGLKRLT